MQLSNSKALVLISFMGLVGLLLGGDTGLNGWILPFSRAQPAIKELPLPHHVPKYPGGVSLRFAMVHDVLTERFAKHGKDYYRERNRLAGKELEELRTKRKPGENPSDRYFALLDDQGAGLEALGDSNQAARLLREKLQEQEALGYKGRQLYTTYANLGTFLIHGNFVKARTGDPSAKELLREGLGFIRKSIEVNPEAHFGREIWQAVAVEFMLAAIENPSLLLKYDMVGNRLDETIDPSGLRPFNPEDWGRLGMARDAARFLQDPQSHGEPTYYRHLITTVGAADDWNKIINTKYSKPVPFDEPTLGIIGMWRLGGGANPHFALALGEVMMRVGQRFLAWTAYERAGGMADRFWPDSTLQEKFVKHCRSRQKIIENQLPSENWTGRQQQFQDELDFGRRYQVAYQDYEAERIKEGASIDDPHFYDGFRADRGPIASPVGQEDKFVVEEDHAFRMHSVPYPSMLLFAGLFAFGTACFLRITSSSKVVSAPDAEPRPNHG
jgi:hypothetical protein